MLIIYWRHAESNRGPYACKTYALPAKLYPHPRSLLGVLILCLCPVRLFGCTACVPLRAFSVACCLLFCCLCRRQQKRHAEARKGIRYGSATQHLTQDQRPIAVQNKAYHTILQLKRFLKHYKVSYILNKTLKVYSID